MTQRRGTVDLDYTQTQLERAGLSHAAERLSELVEEAAKQDLSSHRFLDRLLEVEIGEREERRIKTSLRLSGLPPGQTLGNFDFAFQPSMKKSRIDPGHLRLDPRARNDSDCRTARNRQDPHRRGSGRQSDRERILRRFLSAR